MEPAHADGNRALAVSDCKHHAVAMRLLPATEKDPHWALEPDAYVHGAHAPGKPAVRRPVHFPALCANLFCRRPAHSYTTFPGPGNCFCCHGRGPDFVAPLVLWLPLSQYLLRQSFRQ